MKMCMECPSSTRLIYVISIITYGYVIVIFDRYLDKFKEATVLIDNIETADE